MLAGKTVLITRAMEMSADLADAVRASGGTAFMLPTMAACSNADDAGLDRLFADDAAFDLGVFVSVNAVNAVADWLHENDLAWPPDIKCAAVGEKTAAAVRGRLGIDSVVAPSSGYGARQLAELEEMRMLDDASVAIFESVDGSGFVQMAFGGKCRILVEFPVYRIEAPDADVSEISRQLRGDGIDYVVITSVTGARNLIDMLGYELTRLLAKSRFVVYSERIAEYLERQGVEFVTVASSASDEAVMQAMTG